MTKKSIFKGINSVFVRFSTLFIFQNHIQPIANKLQKEHIGKQRVEVGLIVWRMNDCMEVVIAGLAHLERIPLKQ